MPTNNSNTQRSRTWAKTRKVLPTATLPSNPSHKSPDIYHKTSANFMKESHNPSPAPATSSEKSNTESVKKTELVKMFLEMLISIKLYHWNTHSYAQHKATDDLYEKLDDAIDKFVETMQGKMFPPNRIQLLNEEILASSSEEKDTMVDKTLGYIKQLQNLNSVFSTTRDSDLLNIRDEMVGHLNQFLYLFSFDQI